MSQFFLSCKESRIESNRSFYGCFYLGPFEPSQSITIANALRRTLLSELYGLGIVSVEIEGATHEYSSLPGVRDSVLDILLNFKEIVLKKTGKNFKPQIGYLRARGPGVVRASHLRLPPFVQCVDPDQYIATLADNGFLNLKFTIQYGNKWLSPVTDSPLSGAYNQGTDNKEGPPPSSSKLGVVTLKKQGTAEEIKKTYNYSNAFNNLKKRRLILKKLKNICFGAGTLTNKKKNSYINMFTQSTLFLSKYTKKRSSQTPTNQFLSGFYKRAINNKYPAFHLKNGKKLSKSIEKDLLKLRKNISTMPTTPSVSVYNKAAKAAKAAPFNISNISNISKGLPFEEANPINNIRGLAKTKKGLANQIIKQLSNSPYNKNSKSKKMVFFNEEAQSAALTIDAVFNPITKVNYIIEVNDFKTAPSKMQTSFETSELYEMLKNTNIPASSEANDFLSTNNKVVEKDLKNYMQLISEQQSTSLINQFPDAIAINNYKGELEKILEIKREINALKKETIKHNITLEVWTNGSIHPRDALYEGFKNLIKLFAKLKKINTFGLSKTGIEKTKHSPENGIIKTFSKKIKMGEITSTLLQDLLPLNETSFLSTYVAPKLKNYYLNNESLSIVLKNPVLKRQTDDPDMQNTIVPNELSTSGLLAKKQVSNNPMISLEDEEVAKNSLPKERRDKLENSYIELNKKNQLVAYTHPTGGVKLSKADIGILNLSLRSYTSLKRLKINTIEELLELKDLTKLKKLGKTSVEEIEKTLEKIGLAASF